MYLFVSEYGPVVEIRINMYLFVSEYGPVVELRINMYLFFSEYSPVVELRTNMYLFVSEYGPVVELRINNAKGGGGKLPVSNLKVHQHYYSSFTSFPPPFYPSFHLLIHSYITL